MADIQRNMDIAQGALDRVAPHHGPLFDLPLAAEHFTRHKPTLIMDGNATCGAAAREEVEMNNMYSIPVMSRTKVTCRLAPGHEGAHVSSVRHELPGVWRTHQWV